jgi:hypothetical protein
VISYIEFLVQKGLLPNDAIEKAQAMRDPPEFGVGLKKVAAGGGAAIAGPR